MATVFDVTPENLRACAERIDTKSKEFKKEYDDVYTAVSELRVTYKGVASDTFNKKISGYRDKFVDAEKTLNKYADFLRDYAKKIEDTENAVKEKAEALNVGK